MDSEIREIRLEDMVPFRFHSGRMYEGERLQQLMDSIEKTGLISPVIVRPADNGKYEIICGHNRAKAAKALGHAMIRADIRYGLSDDRAQELFYDSNLNQQSFSDWNYTQKIDAVRYCEKLIRETSRQGKRTDLEKKTSAESADGTCVHGRQKLSEGSKKTTSRDRMAKRLGISTATFSKYRRIIKLPDDLLRPIARLLDEKRISFQAAYLLSNKNHSDIRWLINGIEKYPDRRLDLDRLKELPDKNAERQGEIYPRSKRQVLEILVSPPSSGTIPPIRRKDRKNI